MDCICGIDEAGRGPTAGPVCAAAVVLPEDFPFYLLNDSKKLSEKKRNLVEQVIKEQAVSYAICYAHHRIIDEINILQATLFAMRRSYEHLVKAGIPISLVLIDGNQVPDIPIQCKAIVKGDATVPQIMAASILAKCARDRLMITLDKRYPGWGFAQHKGYPTAQHQKAYRELGPSPIHRLSFSMPQ